MRHWASERALDDERRRGLVGPAAREALEEGVDGASRDVQLRARDAVSLRRTGVDPALRRRVTESYAAQRRSPRPAPSPEAPRIRVTADPAGVLGLLARDLPPWKRTVDVVLAALGIAVGAPLLLAISLAVRLTSRGPVLFVHERTGLGLRRFRMLKFRTMRIDADRLRSRLARRNEMTGPLFKMDRDPRLTPIGGFLRRWSLDELPQLWNVLRGDMTLIGPRALSPQPSRYARWQLERFEVVPGIACSWQAARRGETDFDEWMRSDVSYVRRGEDPRHDLALLGRTLSAVVAREGSR